MSYVKRDKNGKIIAISLTKDLGFDEELNTQSDEFMDFIHTDLNSSTAVKGALQKSDQSIARVTEDLIHLLIKKQVILFTELPPIVQEKLLDREKLRSSLRAEEPSIVDDAGSI